MNEPAERIINEIEKVVVGKRTVIEKVMMAVLSGGHILLDDVPGTGKTTLALAFSRAAGMDFKRLQFTPDVVPSDITGFSIYNSRTGQFEYKPGVVVTNLLLADEINRTSSKTQAALLEVMQEGTTTVDGIRHELPKPFIVIATQNPVGSAGTQLLPQAQLDRFIIRLSMGYPAFEDQVNILKDRSEEDPMEHLEPVGTTQAVMDMQKEVSLVHAEDTVLRYIASLCEATRKEDMIRLGVSPRGALAVLRMAKAHSYIYGRDYLTPEDVREVFTDVCAHRIIISPKARIADMSEAAILNTILQSTPSPDCGR